jgi:hypothetical protein
MAGILLMVGLISLICYGCHSALKPRIAGNLIIISIVVLLIVIAFGVYIHTNNHFAMAGGIAAVVLLFVVGFDIFSGQSRYSARVMSAGSCPEWTWDGRDMFGGWIFLFMVVVIVSWVSMMYKYDFSDIGLYLIGAYVFFSVLYAVSFAGSFQMGANLCTLLTGLALVAWLVGTFA